MRGRLQGFVKRLKEGSSAIARIEAAEADRKIARFFPISIVTSPLSDERELRRTVVFFYFTDSRVRGSKPQGSSVCLAPTGLLSKVEGKP